MTQAKSNRSTSSLLAFAMALTFTLGCEVEDDDFESSYSNHIQLDCNGNVLVDQTFTTLESCESFRDSNTFTCEGIELRVNC